MVPSGWSVVPLEDLASVERGKFSARPRNDPKYYGGDIPFVQTGDIASAGTYLNSFSQTLNQDGLLVSRLFPKGTILITIAANIGDTAITAFDVACPDSLVAIQPKEGVADNYWLKKKLETHKEELDSKATQNAQKNINLQVLKPLQILTPPIDEQRKIAKILSTWDKAISTSKKLIYNSKQQKKALMQQLLTSKKRLLDDSGKPFNGEWKECPLINLLDSIIDYRGQSVPKAESGVPLITARNVRAGYLDFSNQEYIDNNAFQSWMTRGTPRSGDVLFTTEAPLGMACRFPKDGIYGVGQRTVTLRANEKLSSDFLLYFLLSEKGQLLIDLRSSGSTAKGIKSSELKKVKVYFPLLVEEQQKISSVLTNADKEIELLEQQLTDLKQEKKALMQQLLTGKRRVKIN